MKHLLVYLAVFAVGACFSQVSITGKVLDDTLRMPLPTVNVFISELNLVTATDAEGSYSFNNIPRGRFTIQFKLLGYKPLVTTVNTASVNTLDVQLHRSSMQAPEIVIYGNNNSASEKTANSISQLSAADMREAGALNLSEGISKIPGVSQLTTGPGISKPVIRGLFGNRIQTVLMGLRFDNQQWQDEHGLGLSDVGIDRVEIIKGPASLLYGSEAMGGVLNIIEEKPAAVNKIQGDVSTRFFSNTYGNATDAGVKGANEKFNWRIRLGEESHADYSDGNNRRILNSRFGGYYLKAGIGFNRKRWVSRNDYMFSQSNFGFLMDLYQLYLPPDDRLSRSFDRPHHTVNLNIFSSQNTFFLKRSKLKLNAGFQGNNRQEQEGGNKISLNMILNTALLNCTWTKSWDKLEWSLGTQDYYQTNKNVGSRTIIPDAMQYESSVFSYLKANISQVTFEGGIRYDLRHIETYPTGSINTDVFSPGATVVPFSRLLNSLNGSLGLSWYNEKHWNIKANVSTGYRAGNLAELSSNGLHEGTVRYEIGDINLKVEQNVCGDVTVGFVSDIFNLSASAYYNRFFNYIYLAPTSTEYIGFQIYRYRQQNAAIMGGEGVADVHPAKWFSWISSYSYVYGQLDNGNYLPFIPAPKLNSDLRLSYRHSEKWRQLFVRPGVTYVFRQDRPGDFETSTGDYLLVNAAAGIDIKNAKNTITLSLSGNNLLNKVYYDHLSRFKYFGIANIGRNISLNFKIAFN